MSDKSSLEQELLLYLQLRSADSCSPTLLNTLFPDGPEAWLLAFMICSNENNLSAVLSELPGNTACLSAGSDRFLYYFTSIQDESETVLAFLRKNDTYFQKASVSHCYELPVALRIITMEAECNFLDAFVYPNDTIFPCRAPNYPLIEQRVALFTNLVLSGQYQQIQKATTDMPTFFRQSNLGIRDAVLLWNRLGYRSEIHTNSVPYGHLELYELAERFHSIDDMSYYMSQQLSVLLSAERSMAS